MKQILVMSETDFDALPNYSFSLPTGKTIGKRWRRRCRDGWLIGEYFEVPEQGLVGIRWYLPAIYRTKAGAAR